MNSASDEYVNDIIVDAVNVHKVYDTGFLKVHAVKGVSLTIRKGEMVSIMGPSGCGKTTLLNCLSGLDTLTEGSVKIEGIPLETMSDDLKSMYRAKRMGFIFQSYNLLPILTAAENVELPLLVSGVKPKEAREAAISSLEIVGLAERLYHTPAELSGGEQQRVAIARALVNNPAIVWADEPTGNLDGDTSWQIISLLRDLNKQYGQTLVIVTHDTVIAEVTDRVLMMRDGMIEGEYILTH
jgi:putative ABC transport system ATP-binding protein